MLIQTSANGGFPVAISMTVQPNDQISACLTHKLQHHMHRRTAVVQ